MLERISHGESRAPDNRPCRVGTAAHICSTVRYPRGPDADALEIYTFRPTRWVEATDKTGFSLRQLSGSFRPRRILSICETCRFKRHQLFTVSFRAGSKESLGFCATRTTSLSLPATSLRPGPSTRRVLVRIDASDLRNRSRGHPLGLTSTFRAAAPFNNQEVITGPAMNIWAPLHALDPASTNFRNRERRQRGNPRRLRPVKSSVRQGWYHRHA